jgi:hypothetical protein
MQLENSQFYSYLNLTTRAKFKPLHRISINSFYALILMSYFGCMKVTVFWVVQRSAVFNLIFILWVHTAKLCDAPLNHTRKQTAKATEFWIVSVSCPDAYIFF